MNNPLQPFIEYLYNIHLYSWWQISQEMNSAITYGDGVYGDPAILKKAKSDFEEKQESYISKETINTDNQAYGTGYIFSKAPEELTERPRPEADSFQVDILASERKFEEFIGRKYMVDISPEKVFIIFPDLTFAIPVKQITELDWTVIRNELQEMNILEKDLPFLSKNIGVSLDMLRAKIKNQTMTENELSELRKKLYGLAKITSSIIDSKINAYEE